MTRHNSSIEKEKIREALAYLSPDLPRDEWARIGMAIKDGLNGEGFDLFDEWSHGGQTYNAHDTRDTWKSINGSGGITVGTLFYLAAQQGWKSHDPIRPETEAERQQRERERQERAEQETLDKARKQAEVGKKRAALWQAATPTQADHPYLTRKGIAPVENLREISAAQAAVILGYAPQSDGQPLTGRLLVAPVEIEGQISTAELIDAAGRKSAIAGGAKSSGYWAAQPLPEGDGSGLKLLIGEGVATVLSARKATGYASLAALSAGNLPKVAQAMRIRYPAATLVILADLGNGQAKAEEAAQATGAVLAVPDFTGLESTEADTDFNDLHRLAGAVAVQQQIEAALEAVYQNKRGETVTGSAGMDAAVASLRLPTVSPCTHLANSHRIRHYYRGQLWYALGLGWIMWAGSFWRSDPTSEGSIATGFVDNLSRLIAREAGVLSRRASDETDEDHRKALMAQAEALLKWAVQSENERTIAAGLRLTKHALLIEYHTLNADPWLFNVQNGTLDLHTGRLHPHNPADLITFLSPVTYRAAARCPTWERFLLEVFAGDAEMVAFIQRSVGWSLTGVVKERALFFLYGDTGRNGKTTLVEVLMKLFGVCGESSYGYGRKVGADTFMKSKNHEDNQRKAATLAGPRFICTSEVDEEHRLNEQLIKDITGGDTIEGRRLYQEAFTFKPQFKPWMYGNHKPEIRGTDDAIWSRVRLVPFEVSFKGREDLDLPAKLETELSGILNWAIQGCLDWQRIGLQPPAKVQAATQAYREEMDVFGPFIRECCVIHKNAEVWANDLWVAYKAWCVESGMKEQNQNKLGRYLTTKGYYSDGSSGRIKRLGLGLSALSEHSEYSDLIPESRYRENPYRDFSEKGQKGQNAQNLYLTPTEQKALRILHDLHQQHANNRLSGSQDSSKARVAAQDWAAVLRQNGVPLETMESLKRAGQVGTDGVYVSPRETG